MFNKKAQISETMTWIVATLVIIVILALALAYPMIQNANEARGSNGLDCDNAVAYQDKVNYILITNYFSFK